MSTSSKYHDSHEATSANTEWIVDTYYDSSKYVKFQWTDRYGVPHNNIDESIVDIKRKTIDANGIPTYSEIDSSDSVSVSSLSWDPSSGELNVTYSVSNSLVYELRVDYEYSTPYKPSRFVVWQDPHSPVKKVSILPGVKLLIHNTPKPPPPPT